MLAIQPLGLGSADEKLGTVCVGSSICRGQDARTCVLQDEVLIITFLPVDGLAACATVPCEVITLAWKSQNNSVTAGAFITNFFLPSAQSTKIFCCLWNIEEHSGVYRGWTREGPRQWWHLQDLFSFFLIST
ncbi:hypothetical protein HJG60_010856 [Phyllostomus discolor]|uniref:Uncharacterized protein n=1 Tax=Phyllostomus discolor TaxID=89673 RepID=A0A834AEN7_9CHIR|nr:hypothetical protein HJG60_010856 [Phyllostomus discolor]